MWEICLILTFLCRRLKVFELSSSKNLLQNEYTAQFYLTVFRLESFEIIIFSGVSVVLHPQTVYSNKNAIESKN